MTIKKYEGWSQADLLTEAESALRDYKTDPNKRKRGPDLETPTLILHELRHRKKNTWKTQKKIIKMMKEAGHKEIEWLVPVSNLLKGLRKKQTGHYHVYLIRLDFKSGYGVYIGKTGKDGKTVEQRWEEHIDENHFFSRTGKRDTTEIGQQILRYPVAHLQNTSKDDYEILETQIKDLILNSGFLKKQHIKGGH
ncbi:uncharacterized protein METZ01_LOCUS399665 [marine metagenome]|uniref:GIY-YIG domain-containing protein n=1 Tax=marine metagenome TaxID=408172 RepID=A0A382VLM5_9ZZZZ